MVATILWNYGLARMPGVQAGLFLYLVPLVSVVGGILFLHEQMNAQTIVSGLSIVAGVVLAQIQHLPTTRE
jgi:drug/metabolite transporter (DMT)-like permease